MNKRLIDLRNVGCGLLVGVALTLAMGQAPLESNPSPRYQITACVGLRGDVELFILDHFTNKVYQRPGSDVTVDGSTGLRSTTIKELLKK